MQTVLPLIYACSGCSGAGQLANALAFGMDREGLAEMSCISGVGGRVPALLKLARSGRKLIAIDGCGMRCTEQCLLSAGVMPDYSFLLADHNIVKAKGRDYTQEDLAKLLPELRQHCHVLKEKKHTPPLADFSAERKGLMLITG